MSVGNLEFEIPKGVRISCKPTANITAELHLYY